MAAVGKRAGGRTGSISAFFSFGRVRRCYAIAALTLIAGTSPALSDNSLFIPTSGWLVGPASLVPPSADDPPLPCVMMNQFDNGFIFRISGGGEKLYGMAIDFRQAVFEPGETYRIGIDIGDVFNRDMAGIAHDQATLIINMMDIDGVYYGLQNSEELTIKIGNVTFSFELFGVRDGLRRIESCYGSARTPNDRTNARPPHRASQKRSEVKSSPTSTPTPMIDPKYGAALSSDPSPADALPSFQPENVAVMPHANMRTLAAPAKASVKSDEKHAVADQSSSGRFTKAVGDNAVGRMLEKAARSLSGTEPPANRHDFDTVRQSSEQPSPEQPSSVHTSVLSGTWASDDSASVQPVYYRRGDIVHQSGAVDAGDVSETNMRWRAMRGGDLRNILQVWAEYADAELQWNAEDDFAVKKSLSIQGTFEEALSAVLSQYSSDPKGPSGRLHRADGSRTVIVIE